MALEVNVRVEGHRMEMDSFHMGDFVGHGVLTKLRALIPEMNSVMRYLLTTHSSRVWLDQLELHM